MNIFVVIGGVIVSVITAVILFVFVSRKLLQMRDLLISRLDGVAFIISEEVKNGKYHFVLSTRHKNGYKRMLPEDEVFDLTEELPSLANSEHRIFITVDLLQEAHEKAQIRQKPLKIM